MFVGLSLFNQRGGSRGCNCSKESVEDPTETIRTVLQDPLSGASVAAMGWAEPKFQSVRIGIEGELGQRRAKTIVEPRAR